MGSTVSNYLTSIRCSLASAPPRQNGLVKRNWRSIVRMARSWINSALLPSSFWYYAIKRAAETSNYLPIQVNGITTTPFELVYHSKPDIWTLIPLFSDSSWDRSRKRTKSGAGRPTSHALHHSTERSDPTSPLDSDAL